MERMAGLDVGDERIGLAASDELGLLAHPVGIVLRSAGNPVEQVAAMLRERRIGVAVVGLPRNMDGSLGPQAAKARRFAERLGLAAPDVRIVFRDERLTTVQARAMVRHARATRKQRARPVDDASAAIILQGYLDLVRDAERQNS